MNLKFWSCFKYSIEHFASATPRKLNRISRNFVNTCIYDPMCRCAWRSYLIRCVLLGHIGTTGAFNYAYYQKSLISLFFCKFWPFWTYNFVLDKNKINVYMRILVFAGIVGVMIFSGVMHLNVLYFFYLMPTLSLIMIIIINYFFFIASINLQDRIHIVNFNELCDLDLSYDNDTSPSFLCLHLYMYMYVKQWIVLMIITCRPFQWHWSLHFLYYIGSNSFKI